MDKLPNKLFLATMCALICSGASAQLRGDLFNDDGSGLKSGEATGSDLRFSGSLDLGLARNIGEPDHWSHQRARTTLNAQGGKADFKLKLSARLDADAAYVGRDDRVYPAAVRKDQRLGVELRENYFDKSLGSWELRAGKQHVVWGEMVGTFVADVVSPRDLRDFVSTDLENVRRTTWATRLEKFSGDWHSELLWVPVQTYDKIGKPGADFYPYPAPPTPGFFYVIDPEQKPKNNLGNGSFGARTGVLKSGWDIAAFYYTSRDVAQTFERRVSTVPVPITVYTPVHDRIRQFGATFAKDVSGLVLKGEAVVTSGRRYTVTRLDDDDGLMPARSADVALGVDYMLANDWTMNFQFQQRSISRHDDSMLIDKNEQVGSILTKWTMNNAWQAEVLWASSLNRSEGWVSPSLTWKVTPAARLRLGADFFYGPSYGVFGRYDRSDRVTGELRLTY